MYVCARSDNAKASTSQHQDSLFRQPIRELKLPPLRPLIYEAVLIPPGAEVLADRFTYLLQLWRLLSNPIKRPGIELPFGGNLHGFKGVLARGWQANGLIVWNTGMPFSVTNANNRSGTRPATTNSDRPNMIGSGKVSNPTLKRWFNTSDFVAQPQATFGNERRNQLYGPGLQRVDLSLFKNFDITERLILEFRTEAFNVLNTTQFSNPTASLGNALNGQITGTTNAYNPRLIQFAARLKF